MWKIKKKLWPRRKPSLPVAKINHKGRLISSPKELLQTLHKEYKDRLRKRKVKSYLKEHMDIMHEVTKLKLAKAWINKSPCFTSEELENALNNLNRGKARDPHNLCAELFQLKVIGADLKLSLLQMLNEIKEKGEIPNIMRESTVTTIPKSGSKFELKNERGIFKLSILRSILLRLIYNRKYEIIDTNMSESNIGARKGKGCRNPIWVINGNNHEQNSSMKHAQLVVQSFDFTQMFDSMSLDITISDLYDGGVCDDLLVLLDAANRNIKMTVNTFYGPTEPMLIPSLVAQGDLFSPLEAALQVDSMTRKLEEEDRARVEVGETGLLYRYKGEVPIPSLGLMDDNKTVSEAGHKAEQVNVIMNENAAEKNLQFNPKKCKYLSIGRNKKSMLHHTLEVDTWNIDYDDLDNIVESEGKKKNMIEVSQIKYLGFVIADNASNVQNILDKKKKSHGTIRSIISMIKGLETHSIQNGLIYMNSLLRSSVLYAAETYYNLTERNLRMIEMIEEECLKKILDTKKTCTTSLLYLETGQLPARFQIKVMQLNFLKYILHQKKESLIHKFFEAQCKTPTKNDWVSSVRKIIYDIDLNMTFEEILMTKKNYFKKLVNKKVKILAFKYLLSKVKSKGKEITYQKGLQCQTYLLANNVLTIQEQRAIFSFRTRMNFLKNNYKGNYSVEYCQCESEITNKHLYECNVLNNIEKKIPYETIFEGRLVELKYIVNILLENQTKHERFTLAQESNPLSH